MSSTAPAGVARNGHREARAGKHGLGGQLSRGSLQRARILAAAADILEADGTQAVTVTKIVRRASVPRGAFYRHFAGRDEALCALVADALERTRAAVLEASEPEHGWQRQTRSGLYALLALYDAEPSLARLCLTHSRNRDRGMERLRRQTVGELVEHVGAGASEGRAPASALSAECIVAGVLAIIEERVQAPVQAPMGDLLGEVMSFIVLPYRGGRAARAELDYEPRRKPTASAPAARLAPPGLRVTYRTMRVLAVIAGNPGLANIEVAEQAGITDQGQISKLLKRLQALGLIENLGSGAKHGAANSWWLTEEGQRVKRSILNGHVSGQA